MARSGPFQINTEPCTTTSVSSASGTQMKRKAVIRKEFADTQEYERYKQKGIDMYVDENEDEWNFCPQCGEQGGWMA